jgi:hypothetical protein
MTTIKATCPTCGDVDLTTDDVRLRVCSRSELSFYAFDCPQCTEEIRKPADDNIVTVLIAGGVVAEVWEVAEEAFEVHSGPALSYDDLLDFVTALKSTDDLIAELLPA